MSKNAGSTIRVTLSDEESDAQPVLHKVAGVVEYAAALGITISESYVKRETRSGNLPHFVICLTHWYSRRDVRNWLASKRSV